MHEKCLRSCLHETKAIPKSTSHGNDEYISLAIHSEVEFNHDVFLPSATKLRRLCFYTCLSTGGGVSASVHAGIPPPGADTPWEQAPPQGADPPPADGYCCGRYASYWNAFLFIFVFALCKPTLNLQNLSFLTLFTVPV